MISKFYKWWFGKSVSVYPTIKMTGKTGKQVWAKYRKQKLIGTKYGIKVNSPVPGEGIKSTDHPLTDRKGKLATKIWKKDGSQIYKSVAISFEKENMLSQGSIFELVKSRGSLFKITVFIHPKPGFIAKEQADITAKGLDSAYKQLSQRFGSRHQRFMYRITKTYPKFLFKGIPRLFLELFR